MKLLMMKFFPGIVLVAAIVVWLLVNNRKKYLEWIRLHWFFKPSFYNSFSFGTLLLSFLFLLFSLSDVRGPQEQMEMSIPDQKTIILIDSSASMLVEDIKPSRFKRSLFMAKHFVKKAVGHQVGLVLFSNIQKRIVPFTDDVDLLDARISGLETLNISRGGSNIAQAIQESLQYFKSAGKKDKEITGNILIFSDSEEMNTSFNVDVPEKINVAFVGVGTLNGGKIPLRSRNNRFRGYKRYGGQDVISKLNESYIKNLGSKVAHYKYWIASSYTIYTEEIINFFEKSFMDDLESLHQEVVRPVWSHYIASIGIILYILSMIFSQFRSFQQFVILLFLMVGGLRDGGRVWADIPKDLESLKRGKLEEIKRLKLAEKFLRKGDNEKALKLYRENVEQLEKYDFSTLLNYGVALFKSGRMQEGMDVYNYLYEKASLEERERMALQNNLIKALEDYDEEQKKAQKKKEEEESKGQGEEEESQEQGQGQEEDGEQGEKGDDKPREGGGGGQPQEEQESEGKSQEESSQQKKNLTGREALAEKKKTVEKQRKLVKIPEVLKSIMDKERSLQDRAFDTSTHIRKKDRKVKDW